MRRRRIQPGPIGPDVDLDTEEVYTADGRRLTNALADEIAERALERLRGRSDPRRSSSAHRARTDPES